MKRWFPVEYEIRNVKFGTFREVSNRSESQKGVPLVLTHHPLLKSVWYVINKHLNILYLVNNVKRGFSQRSMVLF